MLAEGFKRKGNLVSLFCLSGSFREPCWTPAESGAMDNSQGPMAGFTVRHAAHGGGSMAAEIVCKEGGNDTVGA